MTPITKIKFFLSRPKVIIVAGRGRGTAREAIYHVLKSHFKIGKEIMLSVDMEDSVFYLKNSQLPILAVTHVGDYHPDKEFFDGDARDTDKAAELAKVLPAHGRLVLNFDDETVREIKDESIAHPLTFGFGARADIRVSDIVLTKVSSPGTNFKINYEGNIVPVWLEKLFGKENIYAALTAAAVGEVLGLNLVEISEGLKSYFGIAGKMRLIPGIKNSWILDDTATTSALTMLEALAVLKGIETTGQRIAVLGDVLNIGKYAIEAHETVGEKAEKSADLLFTIGDRAKFFAEGARNNGMPADKISKFSNAKEAALALRQEIKEGDLVLIDGSKEMNMIDIVKEITAPSMPSSSSPV